MLYSSWFCISKPQHLSVTWEWCTRDGQSIPAVVTKVSNTKLNTISFLLLNVTFLVHSRIAPGIVICAGAELLLQNSELLSQVSSVLLPRVKYYPASTASAHCSSVCALLFGCIHTHSWLCPVYEAMQWHKYSTKLLSYTDFITLLSWSLCHVLYSPKSVFYWIYILHYKLFFLHLFCALCVCVTVKVFVSIFTFLLIWLQLGGGPSLISVLSFIFLFVSPRLFFVRGKKKVCYHLSLLNNFFLGWLT